MAQRLFSRPSGWVAIGSGLVLAVGALAGASAVLAASAPPASQAVTAHLGYSCRFPAGTYPASVTVAAAFPASAEVGQVIASGTVRTGITFGPAAASALSRLGAVKITGDVVLATVAGDGMDMTSGQWPGRLGRPAAVRPAASLRLAATGLVPPLTAGRPGTVTFTAAGLALSLSPRTASGRPVRPGMVPVSCALRPGQHAELASVRVGKAGAATSHHRPARRPKTVPGVKFPKGCGKIPVQGIGVPTCAYITGYADVRKLNGAVLLQPAQPAKPGLLNLDFAEHTVIKGGNVIADSTGKLYYKGRAELPPTRGTFLSFGFIPVTATLHIAELAPIKIVSISGIKAPPFPITVHGKTKVSIRVSGASVNGVPLPVGPHCQARSPVTLALLGKGQNDPPKGYTVSTGGPLTGNITIPPFTGCGVTENLDRLFTGSISGPANFNLVTQGQLCGPSQPENFTCPPPVPKPLRKVDT